MFFDKGIAIDCAKKPAGFRVQVCARYLGFCVSARPRGCAYRHLFVWRVLSVSPRAAGDARRRPPNARQAIHSLALTACKSCAPSQKSAFTSQRNARARAACIPIFANRAHRRSPHLSSLPRFRNIKKLRRSEKRAARTPIYVSHPFFLPSLPAAFPAGAAPRKIRFLPFPSAQKKCTPSPQSITRVYAIRGVGLGRSPQAAPSIAPPW